MVRTSACHPCPPARIPLTEIVSTSQKCHAQRERAIRAIHVSAWTSIGGIVRRRSASAQRGRLRAKLPCCVAETKSDGVEAGSRHCLPAWSLPHGMSAQTARHSSPTANTHCTLNSWEQQKSTRLRSTARSLERASSASPQRLPSYPYWPWQ